MKADGAGLHSLPRDAARPLYQQIKDSILERIRTGDWASGERLPSENELVEALGVSRMTITRALRELTQQGHLQRVAGVGTFVAVQPRHASLIELHNIADEIRERGRVHAAQVLELARISSDEKLASAMELPPGASVFHLRMVHFQDDCPIQLEDRHVNPAVAPGFLGVDFNQVTPTQYLVGLIRPDEMEHVVEAIRPDESVCQQLRIAADEPCLLLRRRTWFQGAVVTRANLIYPSSRYHLGARYATDQYQRKPTHE